MSSSEIQHEPKILDLPSSSKKDENSSSEKGKNTSSGVDESSPDSCLGQLIMNMYKLENEDVVCLGFELPQLKERLNCSKQTLKGIQGFYGVIKTSVFASMMVNGESIPIRLFLSLYELTPTHGLELSKVNFIWVVRFPEGEKVKLEDALPNGFLDKVKENGLIVEYWAPQIKILNHSSIGGFVSHCGWGSLIESIQFAVPIIATLIQYDQPWNARLIEECGIDLEVERNFDGGLRRENIAKVIKQVVIEKTGKSIQRKAKEMSDNIKRKCDQEIDEVVKQLLQIL